MHLDYSARIHALRPLGTRGVLQLRRLTLLCSLAMVAGSATAQRHNGGSSPPTAPPMSAHRSGPMPIMPVSSGMGALQFVAVDYGVPAPQSLARQLQSDDDRTRAASLSAIGAPGMYLTRGHIPYPHSVQLNFVSLGTGDELDAIITVELDQHILSAILLPQDSSWRRIATVLYATPFADPFTTPSSFLHIDRSLLQQEHYRAVFHAVTPLANGDLAENEAHIRILNGHAVVIASFVDRERNCDASRQHAGCRLMLRWMEPDAMDPTKVLLVSGTGHISARDVAGVLGAAPQYLASRIHNFDCQPFVFSDTTLHYEPAAASTPCPLPHPVH